MWRIRRRRSLLVALLPKLSSTKTIWPVMQAQEIFCLQNFLFPTQMCLWMIFIFRWNPMNIFFKLQLHTHHSLDFIRELKMLKITGYIHLHYKIPFYVAMLALVSFFFFFWLFTESSVSICSVSDIRWLPMCHGKCYRL